MRKLLSLLLLLLSCLLLSSIVTAAPLSPESYWGKVVVEGELALNGTELSVEVKETGEVLAVQDIPFDPSYDGSYSLNINFDDTFTTKDEGASDGDGLLWRVNGIPVLSPLDDIATSAGVNDDFTIDAVGEPNLIVSLSYPRKIPFYENATFDVFIENVGTGDAKIVVHLLSNEESFTIKHGESSNMGYRFEPKLCGVHNEDVEVNYNNIVDDFVNDYYGTFDFYVYGPDLSIEEFDVTNENISKDEQITANVIVRNTGDEVISGFIVMLYDYETEIDRLVTDSVLNPEEDITVSFNVFGLELGQHDINAVIRSDVKECNLDNDKQSKIVNVLNTTIASKSYVFTTRESGDRGSRVDGSSLGLGPGLGTITGNAVAVDASNGPFSIISILIMVLIVGVFLGSYYFVNHEGLVKEPEVKRKERYLVTPKRFKINPYKEKKVTLKKNSAMDFDIKYDGSLHLGMDEKLDPDQQQSVVFGEMPKVNVTNNVNINNESKGHMHVPFHHLYDAMLIIMDTVNNGHHRSVVENKYLKSGVPHYVIDLAIRACRSKPKENVHYYNELEKMNLIEETYDYVNYKDFVKAIKVCADAYVSEGDVLIFPK